LKKLLRRPEVGVVISLLVITLAFAILSDGKFLRPRNLSNVLGSGSQLGIMTIGIALVLIIGEIDLSVGSVAGFAGLLFVIWSNRFGTIPAFIAAMGVSCLIGLFNGLVITKTEVPSLIQTLGMTLFLRGFIYVITGGFVTSFDQVTPFLELLSGKILGGFYTSIVWFVVIAALFTVILDLTSYGNRIFAVGGNRQVARALGISVDRIRLTVFVICAGLAGFAGCVMAARFRTVAATTGAQMELEAIASAVMGGCLLTGGYGSIPGPCIGALLISSVGSGLVLAGAPAYWYQAFIGIVLVLASIVNLSVVRRVVTR